MTKEQINAVDDGLARIKVARLAFDHADIECNNSRQKFAQARSELKAATRAFDEILSEMARECGPFDIAKDGQS